MRFRNALIAAAVSCLILLGLDRAGLLAGPRAAVGTLTNPIQVGWTRVSQAALDRLSIAAKIGSLAEENLALRAENDQYKADNAKLELLRKENETLRMELGVSQARKFNLEAAQVLGAVPSVGAKELLLGRGSADGVKIGDVVTSGSVALGRIVTVEGEKSTLQLLTDPSAQVLARTSQGATGILVGQFQSSDKLTKILQDETVSIGDTVFTSGEDGWPKDLVIGTVSKVTRVEGELFQEGDVTPSLDAGRLGVVFIIKGSQ